HSSNPCSDRFGTRPSRFETRSTWMKRPTSLAWFAARVEPVSDDDSVSARDRRAQRAHEATAQLRFVLNRTPLVADLGFENRGHPKRVSDVHQKQRLGGSHSEVSPDSLERFLDRGLWDLACGAFRHRGDDSPDHAPPKTSGPNVDEKRPTLTRHVNPIDRHWSRGRVGCERLHSMGSDERSAGIVHRGYRHIG